MEKEIRALFNDDILRQAAALYGFDKNDMSDLHGFQNFVYLANRDTKSCIVRVAHSSHRTCVMTKAELDWVMYLYDHEVKVAAPIRSVEGELVTKIHDGKSYFVVTAFEKAPGAKPHYQSYMEDKEMIKKLGRATGKIHSLTKKYKLHKDSPQRVGWIQNHYLSKFPLYVPDSYSSVVERTQRFLETLLALPKGNDSYGLIHGDIQLNNFHVHKDELTLFDFDECEYNWFAADIANPLFYATPLPSDGKERRNLVARRFYDAFMEGYIQENELNPYWLNRLPLFLRLREILVLSGAFRSLDLNNLHPWSKEMIETTILNIETDQPFLEIDFA